jgi:hypothetical protein
VYNNARQSPGVDEVIEAELRLSQLESLPDPARDAAVKALQAVVALYGAGLERILELAPQLGPMLAEDELVAHLLLVHGLHPVALSSRVEGGVADVRLQGTCHGCPSSTATLTQAIEQAVFKAAPDPERVNAEGVAAPQGISLDSLKCPIP